MADYLLELKDVSKKHHAMPVLRDVNLKISSGRIIGVVGDNGLGKTTLLKLMAGIWKPDKGSVMKSVSKIPFVPSKEEFYSWMKVKDALYFYQTYYGNFRVEQALQLLRDGGISVNDKIDTLSRGQQERLFLILTISQEARLYLMDEPLSGMDPYFKKDIRQFLLKNLPEDATVVMATHLLRELEQLFDEVIFVTSSGVRQMEADEIRQNYGRSIEQYYLEVISHEK